MFFTIPVSYGVNVASFCPEVTAPELLSDLWKVFERLLCSDAFADHHDLRWRISGSCLNKHMQIKKMPENGLSHSGQSPEVLYPDRNKKDSITSLLVRLLPGPLLCRLWHRVWLGLLLAITLLSSLLGSWLRLARP